MGAQCIFDQQNGDVTKAYYAKMNGKGFWGQLAVALFRASKRSAAAKRYRGRAHRNDAYDVKNWSLSEICRILAEKKDHGITWGWRRDPKTVGFEWVLYVDLPDTIGQVSFHSADRLKGPDYPFDWDGVRLSRERVIRYCDLVESGEHICAVPCVAQDSPAMREVHESASEMAHYRDRLATAE